MLDLPIVSLAAGPAELAAQVRAACEGVGFFYLADHGISPAQMQGAFRLSQALFLDRSPAAQGERDKSADPAGNTGYIRFASERLDPAKQSAGDLKESFHLRRFQHAGPHEEVHKPNQRLPAVWSTPEARAELDSFFEACKATSLRILQGFAVAMDLPGDYFAKCHHAELDRLRFLHYPPAPVSKHTETTEVIRAGAHTDYGSVTLLFVEPDGVGGLQVDLARGKDGLSAKESSTEKVWTDVPAKEGMIICNVADAIEFWTGGRYRSTVHRVALPLTEAQAGARFSIAYFCQPDDEAELRPLGKNGVPLPLVQRQWKSTSEEFNTKFAALPMDRPVTGGAYLQARLNATYDHQRRAASSTTS